MKSKQQSPRVKIISKIVVSQVLQKVRFFSFPRPWYLTEHLTILESLLSYRKRRFSVFCPLHDEVLGRDINMTPSRYILPIYDSFFFPRKAIDHTYLGSIYRLIASIVSTRLLMYSLCTSCRRYRLIGPTLI